MLHGENLEPQRCYSWLQQSFWFKQTFTTPDMQYGITEEVNAIASYTKATGNEGHPERFMGTKKVHLPRSEPRWSYFRQFWESARNYRGQMFKSLENEISPRVD